MSSARKTANPKDTTAATSSLTMVPSHAKKPSTSSTPALATVTASKKPTVTPNATRDPPTTRTASKAGSVVSDVSSSSTLIPPPVPEKDWFPKTRGATSHTRTPSQKVEAKPAVASSTNKGPVPSQPTRSGTGHTSGPSAPKCLNAFSNNNATSHSRSNTQKSSTVHSEDIPVYLPSSRSTVASEVVHNAAYFVTPALKYPKETIRDEDVPTSAAEGLNGVSRADVPGYESYPFNQANTAHLRPESKRRRRVLAGMSLQSDFAYTGDSVFYPIDSKGDSVEFPSLATPLEVIQKLGPQSKRNGCDLKKYGMEAIVGACETFLVAYKTLLHQLSDGEESLDGQDHPAKLAREFEQLIKVERYSPFVDNIYAYHRDVKHKAEVMFERLGRYYYLTIYREMQDERQCLEGA